MYQSGIGGRIGPKLLYPFFSLVQDKFEGSEPLSFTCYRSPFSTDY